MSENKVVVFVSYSHENERWVKKTPGDKKSLIPWLAAALERDDVVFWHDERIDGGDPYTEKIEKAIDQADIAVLLVSEDFLSSKFIRETELPRIQRREKAGKMQFVPILLEKCFWEDDPFLKKRHFLPGPKPLIESIDSEKEWTDVRYKILADLKAKVQEVRLARHRVVEQALAALHPQEVSSEMRMPAPFRPPVYPDSVFPPASRMPPPPAGANTIAMIMSLIGTGGMLYVFYYLYTAGLTGGRDDFWHQGVLGLLGAREKMWIRVVGLFFFTVGIFQMPRMQVTMLMGIFPIRSPSCFFFMGGTGALINYLLFWGAPYDATSFSMVALVFLIASGGSFGFAKAAFSR